MRLHSLKNIFSFVLFFFFFLGKSQYVLPEKPAILYPVYDEVNLLTTEEKNNLNQKLIQFSDSTSTEIEIIIIPTTKGEDINFLATRFGQNWQIGQKKIDNGVVFLIATEDRKIAIQQGRAVEKYLSASVSGQIIDYLITPHFKKGEWYIGIDKGTNAVMDALQGKFEPIHKSKKKNGSSFLSILIFILVVIILIAFISSNNDSGNRDDDEDDDVILSRRGRKQYRGGFFPFPGSFGGGGFGGGSSGGGGGFGGFGGGGSFGGGGASGGW